MSLGAAVHKGQKVEHTQKSMIEQSLLLTHVVFHMEESNVGGGQSNRILKVMVMIQSNSAVVQTPAK